MRLLRSRVAIRPDEGESSILILPGRNPNDRSGVRTGTVIAMGPPSLTPIRWTACTECDGSGTRLVAGHGDLPCDVCRGDGGEWVGGDVEIPYGFEVGDRVAYKFGQLDTALPGEEHTAWCDQFEIEAVIDG